MNNNDKELNYNMACILTWFTIFGGLFGILYYAVMCLKEFNQWVLFGLLSWLGVGFFVRYVLIKHPDERTFKKIKSEKSKSVQKVKEVKKTNYFSKVIRELLNDNFSSFILIFIFSFAPVLITAIPESIRVIWWFATAIISLIFFFKLFKEVMERDVEEIDFSKTNSQLLVVGVVVLGAVIAVSSGNLFPESLSGLVSLYGIMIFLFSISGFLKRLREKITNDQNKK